jgi:aldehyde:ferredoxin oxidoreductase
MDMVRTIHADFNNDPKIKQVNRKTGTATIVKAFNAMGALPTFNFSSLKTDSQNLEPSGRATQPRGVEGDA